MPSASLPLICFPTTAFRHAEMRPGPFPGTIFSCSPSDGSDSDADPNAGPSGAVLSSLLSKRICHRSTEVFFSGYLSSCHVPEPRSHQITLNNPSQGTGNITTRQCLEGARHGAILWGPRCRGDN